MSNILINSEYPSTYTITRSIRSIIDEFKDIPDGEHLENKIESLIGRITNYRPSGKIAFITVLIDGTIFQVALNKTFYKNQDEYDIIFKKLKNGDIIGFTGFIAKTKKGQLSIFATELVILTPFKSVLPHSHYGIDVDLQRSCRYLNWTVNSESQKIIRNRHKIKQLIRRSLDDLDFVEIDVPILCNQAGGAIAKPFITHHNDLNQDMFLRIATEIPLKIAVIGGFHQVYCMGSQFRNESIDSTHNPEFETIEIYRVGWTLDDMMTYTEDLIRNLANKINNSYIISWHGKEVDLTKPFQKMEIMPTLELEIRKVTGNNDFVMPNPNIESAQSEYQQLLNLLNIDCTVKTVSKMLDALIGHFLESQCDQPTFLVGHPSIMSSLAKENPDNNLIADRFELFIFQKEIANSYNEQNNPDKQKENFERVQIEKKNGDDEIPPADYEFIEALKFGLPPTGGLGIGIDRLCMLLLLRGNDISIHDVIPFPTRKNVII